MNMIEIFKTNVQQRSDAAVLLGILSKRFPLYKINFDLEDCDNILRVEGDKLSAEKIIEILHAKGHQCLALD